LEIVSIGAAYTPLSSVVGEFALRACFQTANHARRTVSPARLLEISTLGVVYCVIPQHTAAFVVAVRQGAEARQGTPERPKETLAIGLLNDLAEV
jgi:hypothetical protein